MTYIHGLISTDLSKLKFREIRMLQTGITCYSTGEIPPLLRIPHRIRLRAKQSSYIRLHLPAHALETRDALVRSVVTQAILQPQESGVPVPLSLVVWPASLSSITEQHGHGCLAADTSAPLQRKAQLHD